MPKNWKTYKLGEIGNVIGGGTPSTKKPNYYNGEIAWITPRDLSNYNSKYISKGERSITKEGLEKSSAKLMPKGTVLMSSRAPIGYLAISENEVSTNQGFKSIVVDKNKADNQFVYYLLKDSIDILKQNASGSTFQEVSGTVVKNLEIDLPPLQEQKAIAQILSAIDDKIENNLAINKTLEEMAMALYKHWFVDFGPFQDGEFIDSELGKIPKGWEVKKFNDLIEKIIDNRGKTPPLSKVKTSFLLLETYQLSRNSLFPNEIKENKAKYVSEEIYNNLKWFRKGHPQFMDILFATVGNGIPNWSLMYENKGVGIAQNVVAIRPRSNISSSFLRYSFESQSFLDQFDGYVITTAQPSIKLSDLNMIDMLLPKQEIMDEWNKMIGLYVDQVYIYYKENQTLTKLRDTLLPKLISGEIRLKEFQEKVENVIT